MSFPQEGNADCSTALEISDSLYGPTVPLEGFGKKLDIETNDMKDPYMFEREHNTIWYKFDALYTAELAFDIIAVDTADDFDFILFKYDESEDFCKRIKKNEVRPVRSNMAKSKAGQHGRSGLSYNAEAEYVISGPGDP